MTKVNLNHLTLILLLAISEVKVFYFDLIISAVLFPVEPTLRK